MLSSVLSVIARGRAALSFSAAAGWMWVAYAARG